MTDHDDIGYAPLRGDHLGMVPTIDAVRERHTDGEAYQHNTCFHGPEQAKYRHGMCDTAAVFEDLDRSEAAVVLIAESLNKATADLERLSKTFADFYKADMRAIKMWQAAHPGKEGIWPDHADLVVWLLGRLES